MFVEKKSVSPSSGKERFDVFDALRGFALFGIFVANIRFFAGWDLADEALRQKLSSEFLHVHEFLHLALVDGKFYTLFSLLFGIGFALQMSRLDSGSPKAIRIYIRRLTILLLIGLIVSTQFWFAEILTPYALMGFALLILRNCSDRQVLIAAGICFLIPPAGYLLAWAAGVSMDLGFYAVGQAGFGKNIPGFNGDMVAVLASNQWQNFFVLNQSGSWIKAGYYLESWRIPKILFVMLIGLWTGRKILNSDLLQNDAFFKKVAFYGIAIGIPFTVIYAQLGKVGPFAGPSDLTGFFRMMSYMLSVFPLGFAYGALFVLLWNRNPGLLKWNSLAGRAALTNYLMQAVIGIVIFYGIGFGLVGQVEPLTLSLIAVAVFLAQVAVSHLWLIYFKFGPLEWLWRCATYLKYMPISKRSYSEARRKNVQIG